MLNISIVNNETEGILTNTTCESISEALTIANSYNTKTETYHALVAGFSGVGKSIK